MEFDDTILSAKKFFKSGKTNDLEWRENQLRALMAMIEENRDRIFTCLRNDLNKTEYEAELYEITAVLNEVALAINNMKYWLGCTLFCLKNLDFYRHFAGAFI
jgi:aldehyde dehydrogenase (NAD+)